MASIAPKPRSGRAVRLAAVGALALAAQFAPLATAPLPERLEALLPPGVRPGLVAAHAEELALTRYGARFGLSSEPEQVTFGAYVGLGELAPDLQLRPSVDLGFGDDLLSLILNVDFQYYPQISRPRFHPYFGGGFGAAYYDSDHFGSKTDFGLGLYLGAEKALSGYRTASLELRAGIDELPDLKITFGIGFY